MKINEDEVVFSTGKSIYANNGIIGINADLSIHEGYDGGYEEPDLTNAEWVELSDFMIGLWQAFKAQHERKEGDRDE